MIDITINVLGRPRPQGSRNWKVPVRNAALEDYRARVAHEANVAWMRARPNHVGPIGGPVDVEIEFVFDRPKSHFGTGRNAAIRKKTAPICHLQKPDIDKLSRSILDALTGIIFVDDSQVIYLFAHKTWADRGHPARTVVRIRAAGEFDR